MEDFTDYQQYEMQRLHYESMRHENELNPGVKVFVNNENLQEHKKQGTLKTYDPESSLYFVEFDKGPPWRGFYEADELEITQENQ